MWAVYLLRKSRPPGLAVDGARKSALRAASALALAKCDGLQTRPRVGPYLISGDEALKWKRKSISTYNER